MEEELERLQRLDREVRVNFNCRMIKLCKELEKDFRETGYHFWDTKEALNKAEKNEKGLHAKYKELSKRFEETREAISKALRLAYELRLAK